MKYVITALAVLVLAGAVAFAASTIEKEKTYTWRYKITVTVETPDGDVSGSAVRIIGNDLRGSTIPELRGEAVVVDMGERGVFFALISDSSLARFGETFPRPNRKGAQGMATWEGLEYHASLPIGTTGTVNPGMPAGYPYFVTFKDMDDPKSVTKIQDWERMRGQPWGQQWQLKEDRFEEVFGDGVKLKDVIIEITDEPVTWGGVDRYLPKTFYTEIKSKWRTLPREVRVRLYPLTRFKYGEKDDTIQ